MSLFSESYLKNEFNLADLDQTVTSTLRLAVQNPETLYLFFQRYTYFNAYVSALISRLASSISLSRYLFNNSELLVKEEADRGMEIAAQVMSAAADEGTDSTPIHRALAQLLLKTVGDYAELSANKRNEFAKIPAWLNQVIDGVIENYQGTPGDIASLIKAMGFHLASEILGDREYALLDMVVRYENKGIGFDRYLLEKAPRVKIHGHVYSPWTWVAIHSKFEESAAEAEHTECAFNALNMTARYCSEPEQQILEWVLQGFTTFVELQQRLFNEIYRECLELQETQTESLVLAEF
ncbi:MAG: hypothetical protein WCA35_16430 [Kovacikia sp.]